MSNFTEQEFSLLAAAVDATNKGSSIYAQKAAMTNLADSGFVVGNDLIVNQSDGAIAFGATQAGINFYNATIAAVSAPVAVVAAVAPAPAPQTGGFAIGNGFEAPAKITRTGAANAGRGYPFEALDLNGYIFVPATAKRPDPKKSLASTISSANNRFKDFAPRRYFKTFRAAEGQKFGSIVAPSAGAYIVRVEPPIEENVAPVAA